MTLTPSLNQSTVAQCSAEELVRLCGEEGFRQVELVLEGAESLFTSRGAEEWGALLRGSGVEVSSLNSLEYFSLTPDSSFQMMEEKARFMCSLCSLLGTDLLVVVPSFRKPRFSSQEILEKTAANLEKLARVAEDFGVRLGFEPIGLPWYSVRKWETGMRIVDEVGRDDVGLVVDTWNFFLGGNHVEELRATPIEKLWMFHLVDAPRQLPPNLTNGHRLLPGEGGLPLKEFIGTLRQMGYSGPVSVELFNEELWSMPAQDAVRRSFCAVDALLSS
jgi:2-keto-myo-inositol isomerase